MRRPRIYAAQLGLRVTKPNQLHALSPAQVWPASGLLDTFSHMCVCVCVLDTFSSVCVCVLDTFSRVCVCECV